LTSGHSDAQPYTQKMSRDYTKDKDKKPTLIYLLTSRRLI